MKGPRISTAEFLTSAPTQAALPPPGPPEIAFAGRSNVGKSSLINSLCAREKLVRTSSTPGCTRALNFFHIAVGTSQGQRELRFVDLPGYGYARVSKQERLAWQRLIEGYLTAERPLAAVVLICDARRGPEEEEAQLLEYLRSLDVPAVLVATKLDKLPRTQQLAAAARAGRTLGLSDVVGYSSVTGDGRDVLWRRLLGLAADG
jgi:GTP-binding protein